MGILTINKIELPIYIDSKIKTVYENRQEHSVMEYGLFISKTNRNKIFYFYTEGMGLDMGGKRPLAYIGYFLNGEFKSG